MRHWIGFFAKSLALVLSLLLAACAGLPLEANNAPSAPALAAAQSEADRPSSWPATWQHFTLPGKTSTEYLRTRVDGRDAMAANAASSASLMRKAVNIPASELDNIKFSWKVPDLIDQADLAVRENADSPVRIVLAFDGDRSKFSTKNAILSELAHVMTGEPMPYATLMYVWSNQRAPGSVIVSSRTDRVRKIVVESGALNLNQWLDYERNIRADFEKAFGEAPGALVGVGIMTDTDNTRTTSRAWYGPVSLAGRR